MTAPILQAVGPEPVGGQGVVPRAVEAEDDRVEPLHPPELCQLVPHKGGSHHLEPSDQPRQMAILDEDRAARVARVQVEDSCTVSSLCLLYTSPSPRDQRGSRMPSSA